MAPEAPKENIDTIPDQTRTKLEAARATLEKEASTTETTGVAKLAATNLGEAIDTNNRANVSAKLKQLRNSADFKRLSTPIKKELDQLQIEVETTSEKAIRLTQEGAGQAMEAVGQLPVGVRYPLVAGLVVGGTVIAMKTINMIKKMILNAWDVGADIVEATGHGIKKGVKTTWKGLQFLLTVAGLTGLGITAFNATQSNKEKTNKAA